MASFDDVIVRRLQGIGGRNQQASLNQRADTGPTESVLANRLLDLWSWGHLSTPVVQYLAEAGVQDGLRQDNIQKLAGIGAQGVHAGNTRRDLLRVFPVANVPLPLEIRVPYIDVKLRHEDLQFQSLPVIMPNELFDYIYCNHPSYFERMLGSGLDAFGSAIPADNPKLANHPMLGRANYKTSAVPLTIFGDGVRFTQKGNSLHTLTWSFMTDVGGSSWESVFLFGAFPQISRCQQRTHGVDTMTILWRCFCHGLKALFEGIHPVADPDGIPWPEDSYQAKIGGTQIAGGRFLVCFLASPWIWSTQQTSSRCLTSIQLTSLACTAAHLGTLPWVS